MNKKPVTIKGFFLNLNYITIILLPILFPIFILSYVCIFGIETIERILVKVEDYNWYVINVLEKKFGE